MKLRTMRKKMMTSGLGAQAALVIIGAFLIMGCGGGGGDGSASAGGGSFVVALNGGQPVTYTEGPTIGSIPDPAMMSTVMSGFGTTDMTILIMAADYNASATTMYDVVLEILFEGSTAGDYPIDSTSQNVVFFLDNPGIYWPSLSGHAGTIRITRYDSSKIEGEIVGLTLIEESSQNLITFDCNFSMSPGFDMGGFIP